MSDQKTREQSSVVKFRDNHDVVAEPRHRVGPKGVSSGLSFRELPEPCFHQLKKVCFHYTEKCSGKYENNKMAARYVHQLASEVLFLLSGISEEIQIHQDIAKLAEQRLGEWNTNFPESLKEIGSPHDIASLISSQRSEIRSLTESLQSERASKQRDMSHAMKSMDCQLHASRTGALNERHKLSVEYDTLKGDMEQQLDDSRREKEEDEQRLREYFAAELKAKDSHYQSLLGERDSHFRSEQKERQAEHACWQKEKDSLNATINKQKEVFKVQLKEMQDKIDSNDGGSSVATDDMSLDDSDSGSMFSQSDMSRTTTETSSRSGTGAGSRGSSGASVRKYKKRLRRVLKELSDCHEESEEKNAQLSSLTSRLRTALAEVRAGTQKLEKLKGVNEELRFHLLSCSSSCGGMEGRSRMGFEAKDQCHVTPRGGKENVARGGNRRLDSKYKHSKEVLNVLQHTPHFLHHSSEQAAMRSVKHVHI